LAKNDARCFQFPEPLGEHAAGHPGDVCCQLSEALRAVEEADQNLGRPAAVEES
jgi:hypothetical protein